MTVLAIDQGTSSTKALVVRDDGVVLAEAEVAVHPHYADGDAVEQDPEELWSSVLAAGSAALARAACAIDAVGLANQGETVLAWDRAEGRPLSTAISWQDRRAAAICDRLRDRADWLQAHTGLPLDPAAIVPLEAWLRISYFRQWQQSIISLRPPISSSLRTVTTSVGLLLRPKSTCAATPLSPRVL